MRPLTGRQLVLLGVAVLGGRPLEAQEAPTEGRVREIADLALRDVAVAVYHPQSPVILYNPVLMRRLGPELARFFMAHEYAHLELRHTRAAGLGLEDAGRRDELMRQRELEADCLAARRLGPTGRSAVLAAVGFFLVQGGRSFDAEHPTGTERAALILACFRGRPELGAGEAGPELWSPADFATVAAFLGPATDAADPQMTQRQAVVVH